jgi:hypothetical protein
MALVFWGWTEKFPLLRSSVKVDFLGFGRLEPFCESPVDRTELECRFCFDSQAEVMAPAVSKQWTLIAKKEAHAGTPFPPRTPEHP